MTIEQKAKAYDKVSKEVKDFFEGRQKMYSDVEQTLEYLFPELKESKDERIRKAIVATIHLYYGEPLEDEAKEMIAWLEKQKTSEEALQYLRENHSSSEMSDFQAAMNIAVAKAYDKGYNDGLEKQGETYTKKDIDNAYIEGMAFAKDELEKQNKQILANSAKTCKDEQQPTDNDMKELLHTEYEKDRADAIAEMQKPVDCIDCTNSKGCINCKDGNMKETLVRNLAWSEEDEMAINAINQLMEDDESNHGWDRTYIDDGNVEVKFEYIASWLKSLKVRVQPQPKQEWSEEDERTYKSIIYSFAHNYPLTIQQQEFVKSLKHQNRWKPSNEQMGALANALSLAKNCGEDYSFDLRTLYEQLKKLKD